MPSEIPPLLGCLYCHTEGTTTLAEGRKVLGMGSDYPVLRCSHCDAVAWLDMDDPLSWRIRYRRAVHAPEYYYVAQHLGCGDWLSAEQALAISTDGFVQRRRVQQAQNGELGWLQPVYLDPPLPMMEVDEAVYLSLKGVTLQEATPAGLLVRPDQGRVLDSGKFYATEHRLYLLGQRQPWSHMLHNIQAVNFDAHGWHIVIDAPEQALQLRAANMPEQFDAQLVAAIVETLWRLA